MLRTSYSEEEAGVGCAFLRTVEHIMIWGNLNQGMIHDGPFCLPADPSPPNTRSNMDLARIYRLLRLMQLLSSNVDYTTPELKELLEISERSIFRYLEVFKDAGYALQKKDKNIHKLFKMPADFIDLKDLVYISKEEAHILHTLLMSISGDSQIHINLEQKLAALFDDTSITEIIGHKCSAENVRMLKEAMDRRKRVVLMNYESSHSTSISDRIVEPYGFSVNYSDVYAYEVTTGLCKIFKICRIGWVRMTEQDWENERHHEDITQDCFRMSGKESIPVTLKMTLKAKNLLIEEYPLSQKHVTYEDGHWYLRTTVKDLAGVGRFYLGLSDQIRLVESPELERHVRKHVETHLSDFKSKF